MNRPTRIIANIALNPYTVLGGTISSIISFLWLFYDRVITVNPSNISLIVFVFALCFFILINSYSISIRNKLFALTDIASYIHNINHEYRNVLKEMFSEENPITGREQLIQKELSTIKHACQVISKIYTRLIGKDCTVTVKLITNENNISYCTTYARSIEKSTRDDESPKKFTLGTGANIGFDTALRLNNELGLSFFYSGDLIKEGKKYTNERQHFDRHYRSTIVVPIRYLNSDKIGTPEQGDDIGFLCVDTKSRNRLNDGYHIELLAAFADQMYNFFCLMRGKYCVLADKR